jgi:hypothetical protein
MLSLAWWWGIATNGNILTITPFAIYVGNCPLASSAQACILHLFQASILRASSTQHSPSSVSTMLGPYQPFSAAASAAKLHKSHTYCPRQMSSSSLIFSMGAISMKVNPAFVSILIIAISLAIHLSTHI